MVAGINFSAWDLGGHEGVRHLWSDYYGVGCKALLFLIDAVDVDRLEEAGYKLDALLVEIEETIPVAIMLNKCDLPEARPSAEICEKIQYADFAHRGDKDTCLSNFSIERRRIPRSLSMDCIIFAIQVEAVGNAIRIVTSRN